jgi:hypothetical protein
VYPLGMQIFYVSYAIHGVKLHLCDLGAMI